MARVLDYLRDRREFEIESYRRLDGLQGEEADSAAEEVRRRFQEYRARHLAPAAAAVITLAPRGTVDPDGIQWQAVKVSGNRATTRTIEPDMDFPGVASEAREYEYTLAQDEGRWLLTDRRVKDPFPPGRWHGGLL